MLKVDGSHKYVKLVRVFDSGAAGGTKPVHCMVTFFNEFEQVCCEWLIRAEIQFQYEVYLSGPFFFRINVENGLLSIPLRRCPC